MATATIDTLIARIDAMGQQMALLYLRQTELENQIRSVGRLWTLMQDMEDKIRPDAACCGDEQPSEGEEPDHSGDREDLVG